MVDGRLGALGSASDGWMHVNRSSNPIKGSRYFLEQETLPSLHSTCWFEEWIRA